MPEAEPREGLQLLLYPAPWLDINSIAPVLAEVRGIQQAANGSNVSHSVISPDLSSFRSAANTLTFSWAGYRNMPGAKVASLQSARRRHEF